MLFQVNMCELLHVLYGKVRLIFLTKFLTLKFLDSTNLAFSNISILVFYVSFIFIVFLSS
jgi:hypothetical protein